MLKCTFGSNVLNVCACFGFLRQEAFETVRDTHKPLAECVRFGVWIYACMRCVLKESSGLERV